jgi:hypothetical protein
MIVINQLSLSTEMLVLLVAYCLGDTYYLGKAALIILLLRLAILSTYFLFPTKKDK